MSSPANSDSVQDMEIVSEPTQITSNIANNDTETVSSSVEDQPYTRASENTCANDDADSKNDVDTAIINDSERVSLTHASISNQ